MHRGMATVGGKPSFRCQSYPRASTKNMHRDQLGARADNAIKKDLEPCVYEQKTWTILS